MHNLFLGTAKHIMKNIWLDEIKPIIPKRLHVVIQDKVDRCEIPSSIGRIPHKIASSFSSFTACQINGKHGRLFFLCMPYMTCYIRRILNAGTYLFKHAEY